jgi:hypothetical protein
VAILHSFLPGDGIMPWTPPEAPDPSEVLDSAVADTQAGTHADALAKYLWFHHNALRYDDALAGVRLSFALGYWLELADVYPPARAAFVRTRDETEAAFQADPTRFDLFHDLAALNQDLGDGLRTADTFAGVARRDPAAAGRLYRVAEPFLVAAGRYEECGPFLDPPRRLWHARNAYKKMTEFEGAMPAGEGHPPKLARRFYVRDVGTLVGLLALNGRHDEAGRMRGEALTVLDDEEFRAVLDAAISGHLPPGPG